MNLIIDVRNAHRILSENKQRHVAEYDLQTDAWKKSYLEYTASLQVWSQSQPNDADATQRPSEPSKPRYYVADYDKLLNKLAVHVEATIALGESNYSSEYEQIFENKFDWSKGFATLSASYISSGHISEATINTVRAQ